MTGHNQLKKVDTEGDKGSSFKLMIAQNIVWIGLALIIVLGGFAKDWFSERVRINEFTLHTLDRDSKRDIAITDELYNILSKMKSDRAYIFRFHNGGVLAGGVPFKKMSCTHEVVSQGISREMNNQKDIPLSSVPEFTKMIVDNDSIFAVSVNDLRPGTFRSILETQNIKYVLIHRILLNGEVWGFMGVDYNTMPDLSKPETAPCKDAFDIFAHLVELEVVKAAQK